MDDEKVVVCATNEHGDEDSDEEEDMEFEEGTPIVIDNGSFQIKAGFSSDDVPTVKFENVTSDGLRPIQRKIVCDWEGIEEIWHYTIYGGLKAEPEEHPVLMSESALNPKELREKCMQIMFYTFNVPKCYLAQQAVLSLYASGRTTGIVVDSGYKTTEIVPVYEGHALSHAALSLHVGGKQIDERIAPSLLKNTDDNIIRDTKEKDSYVAFNYSQELAKATKQAYRLPDGNIITPASARFRCTEILFQPDLGGIKSNGVHQLLNESVIKCNKDIRADLFGNIIMSGGSTMLNGFKERLEKEIKVLVSSDNTTIKVIASEERKHSQWIGGSILASLSTFEEMWITSEEYDEYGPIIVHRKCF